MNLQLLLSPINHFLHCPTPEAWIEQARKPENLSLLLNDHLICELKAAQTGMFLIRKYVADKETSETLLALLHPYEVFAFSDGPEPDFLALHKALSKRLMPKPQDGWEQSLIDSMLLLIKEELHHFWQVREIMLARDIPYVKMTASRYAKSLLGQTRTHEPLMLVDKLICGAYIEARSCERFAAIAPYLDDELSSFYLSLLRSEARHYQDYLSLAQQIAGGDIQERVAFFGKAEATLIQTPDDIFRFHSGIPACV